MGIFTHSSRETRRSFSLTTSILFLALVAVIAGTWYFAASPDPRTAPPPSPILLSPAAPPQQFRISDVPRWLFTHVGIIAALQVLAVLAAAYKASQRILRRSDLQLIQFLIEVPMYLGLFGTLLGVSLTQFLTGTLVAPLAYLTTMNGILLHVFGRLTISIPASSGESEEE